VNESPDNTVKPDGWSTMDTTHYFGVFTEGNNQAYSITVDYTSNPNIVNESNFKIASRSYTENSEWTDITATLNNTDNTLTKSMITYNSASEFVLGLNYPPVIGSISDQTTLEDISTSIISFTAIDAETAASNLILTMTSSNQTLVPDEYLIYLSNAGEYSIVATPSLNQYGTTTISVTITDDDGLSVGTSFNLTVTDVDDSQYTWENFQAADVVLGQPDFTSNASSLQGETQSQFWKKC
jgi:hypothetical protein